MPQLIIEAKDRPNVESLTIKKLQSIAHGKLGEIYQVAVKELPNQILVDKCREVDGTSSGMEQATKDLLEEYFKLRNLSHPGVVELEYFVHKIDEQA